MVSNKIFVDRDEFMGQMIKCISSDEWKMAFKDKSKSELTAAMGGVGFASIYASANTPQYIANRTVRPCNWCGECPIWTIAFEEGSELDTWPKVVAECVRRDCPVVGEDVRDAQI